MPEDAQEYKPGVPVKSGSTPSGSAQFGQIITTAVARLENARRNIQMYPEGHETIRESLVAAHSSLVAVFAHISPFVIEVEKHHLVAAHHPLDNRQGANNDFWTQLKHYGIVRISIDRGISQKELHYFLKLFVGAKDQAHRHETSFRKKVGDMLPHVTLTFVAYNGLALTIEEEVSTPVDRDGRVFRRGVLKTEDDLRTDGVYVLGDEEDPSAPSPGTSPDRPGEEMHVTPGMPVIQGNGERGVAGGRRDDNEPSAQNIVTDAEDYEKLLETYFDQAETDNASGMSGETEITQGPSDSEPQETDSSTDKDAMDLSVHAADYEKQLERYFDRSSTDQASVLSREAQKELVQTFLKQLNPTLKKQFAAFDFEQLFAKNGELTLTGMGAGEDVQKTLEALRQANEEDKEISPTLISLVKKMLVSSGGEVDDKSVTPSQEALQDKLENLFEREAYEKFVVDKYDKKLKQLTSVSMTRQDASKDFPVDTYLKTLEETWINRQIAHAMTALIEEEDLPELYKDYLNCLIIISHDFLQCQAYDMPEKIVVLIRRHGEQHPKPAIARLAQKEMATMMAPAYLNKVIGVLKYQESGDTPAKGFISALGPGIVPGLVKLYFEKSGVMDMRCIVNMLSCFHGETVHHLKEMITHNEGFLSDGLVDLMSRFKDDSFITHFKRLLGSDHPDTRDKALDVLLEYGDGVALDLVKARIQDKSDALSLPAITRVGRFNITSLVPVLIEELGRRLFFLKDITKKKTIVGVLGDMATPDALPMFETIVGRSISLRKADLTALKVAVYQSLGKFDPTEIQTLIDKGKKMKHERIKAAIAQYQGGE